LIQDRKQTKWPYQSMTKFTTYHNVPLHKWLALVVMQRVTKGQIFIDILIAIDHCAIPWNLWCISILVSVSYAIWLKYSSSLYYRSTIVWRSDSDPKWVVCRWPLSLTNQISTYQIQKVEIYQSCSYGVFWLAGEIPWDGNNKGRLHMTSYHLR